MNCRSCGQEIHFDNSLKSPSGKSIPLQGATGYDKHDCPNNPYKQKTKQEFANVANKTVDSAFTDKNELVKINDELVEIKQLCFAILKTMQESTFKTADKVEGENVFDTT